MSKIANIYIIFKLSVLSLLLCFGVSSCFYEAKSSAVEIISLIKENGGGYPCEETRKALFEQAKTGKDVVSIQKYELMDTSSHKYTIITVGPLHQPGKISNSDYSSFWVFGEQNELVLARKGIYDNWEYGYRFNDSPGLQLYAENVTYENDNKSSTNRYAEVYNIYEGRATTIVKIDEYHRIVGPEATGVTCPIYKISILDTKGIHSTLEYDCGDAAWVLFVEGDDDIDGIIIPNKYNVKPTSSFSDSYRN